MLRSSFWFPSCSDESSKFDSFAYKLGAVLYLRVIGGTNFSFIGEWREYISQVLFSCLWFNSQNSRRLKPRKSFYLNIIQKNDKQFHWLSFEVFTPKKFHNLD